jgi:Domain of unknown function (DUF4365)
LLPQQSIEEQISLAHVQAIAGRAGVTMSYFNLDYGFDGTFRSISRNRGTRLVTQGFGLDFQLKASVKYIMEPEWVVYDLEAKTYNDLIDRQLPNRRIPCVLLLKTLPAEQDMWLKANEDALILGGGCYWAFLSGVFSSNTKTVRIRIPREQLFSPASLRWMLNRIGNGEWP